MPARLGATYVGEDNLKKTPVMLHRAILGSLERFIGILVEHYAGALPVWLAPVQVAVLNISKNQMEFAQKVENALSLNGIRVLLDLRNEKISYKIREHSLQKIPYQIIVGDAEVNGNVISVRNRLNKDMGQMTVADFVECIHADCMKRL